MLSLSQTRQRLAPACTVWNRIHDYHSDDKAQEVDWPCLSPRSHQDRPTPGARGNQHTLGNNHAIMQPVLEGNIQSQAIRHLVKSHKFLKNLDILNSFSRWLKYLIPSGLVWDVQLQARWIAIERKIILKILLAFYSSLARFILLNLIV